MTQPPAMERRGSAGSMAMSLKMARQASASRGRTANGEAVPNEALARAQKRRKKDGAQRDLPRNVLAAGNYYGNDLQHEAL